MQRVAFLLRLKPGMGPEYDKSHQNVWPEMLDLLKRAGIAEYSIFRRDELLFLYMHVDGDFDSAWDKIDQDPVNLKWQRVMGAYFAANDQIRAGERFPMMKEVFYLP